MIKKTITPPLEQNIIKSLNAGDEVFISGTIFTARDAAHKRLCSLLKQNSALPLDLSGQIIYYTGPSPSKPGKKSFGSAGPTTSGRMDRYSPALIEKAGLRGMIGKGTRDSTVIDSIKTFGCIYFSAIGGAGALLAQSIKKHEIVCYEDLGPEAIYKLDVEKMPAIVTIDSAGRNLYVDGPKKYNLS